MAHAMQEGGCNMVDRPRTTLELPLNAELARLLRQHGLEAEAEQSIHYSDRRHRFDVLVELGDRVVGIEAGFTPTRTLGADAEQRTAKEPIRWRGLPVTLVVELTYPECLRDLPESRAREALARCKSLEFQQHSPNFHKLWPCEITDREPRSESEHSSE